MGDMDSTANYQITLKNKRVYEFYKSHTSISFETMNVFMVEMLEKMVDTSHPSLDQNLAHSLLEEMSKVKQQLEQTNREVHAQVLSKMSDMKKDYMRDLQLLMTTNNTDKLGPMVQQYNTTLEDKIKILMHELLPKSQEGVTQSLTSSLKDLHHGIQRDTQTLLQSTITKKTLEEFVSAMDNKFAKSLMTSQSAMTTLMNSSEQRLNHKIGEGQTQYVQKMQTMETRLRQAHENQERLQISVGDLLKKLENSSAKGKISENLLQGILHNTFPTAQIDFVGTTKEMGDIIMTREGKPTILFENKNYDKNVVQEEVKKFLRDVEIQNCSGIMCAQHYGIANKENYQIDVHNGNVLVYVHAMEYDREKLKIAVDIIDHFKATIEDLEYGDDVVQLEKTTLDDINKEYQQFVSAKAGQAKIIKEYNQKMLSQLDEWKLPQLEHLLSKYFASTVSKDFVCSYCNYQAKNQRALMAHHRGCTEKKKHMQIDINTQPQTQTQTQPQTQSQSQQQKPLLQQTLLPSAQPPLQQTYKSQAHAAFVQNQQNKNVFVQNGASVSMGMVGTVKHK